MIWEKRFHRLISLATFAMASVLGAQTRWDKVALSYTNQCNVYSVEISGVNDTCFSSFETEFVDQNAEPVFRTLNKKFNIFFGDTGTYYGTTLIKNKCNRDDTTLYLTLKVICKPMKCDWFSAKLKQYNQNRYYQWQLENIYPDSCLNYQYRFYNYQTGKVDTGKHYNGLCNYTFPSAGKFKMSLSIWNRCRNCDTLFVKDITILSFETAQVSHNQTRCDSLESAINSLAADPKDTCWKYYFHVFRDASFDTIPSNRWNSADTPFYKTYRFPDSALVYSSSKGRSFQYRFPSKGRYIISAVWLNRCLNQDTVIHRRFEIPDCYAGINTLAPPAEAPTEIINLLGQSIPLNQPLPKNQVLLFRYRNRAAQKIMIRE
jgi:hypothetical protein